jgi:hypothetical protein
LQRFRARFAAAQRVKDARGGVAKAATGGGIFLNREKHDVGFYTRSSEIKAGNLRGQINPRFVCATASMLDREGFLFGRLVALLGQNALVRSGNLGGPCAVAEEKKAARPLWRVAGGW